ncbi:hypothetical protein PAP18089_01897 [Pandoraea apista]|uniref:Uncharacterized protein n=1 Tax=Pandoraea apista TaxID=93218 RepID=A0A5E5P3R3_9BURK|nr:hypothetical protein PAP18089_01897 [Pandoraea apista]
MDCLRDHNIERRQAWILGMQHLPGPVPAGFTTGRKSDFARPRRTLILGLLTLAAAIVYVSTASQTDPKPPAPHGPSTRVIYASGIASTLSGVEFGPCTQNNSHSVSSSSFTHEGKGNHESMLHGFLSSWCSSACRTSSALAESTVSSDNRLL